jgi:hypothetical protein
VSGAQQTGEAIAEQHAAEEPRFSTEQIAMFDPGQDGDVDLAGHQSIAEALFVDGKDRDVDAWRFGADVSEQRRNGQHVEEIR